jgi:predicted aconitase
MLKELCVSTFKVEYICSTLNALGLSRIHVRKGMSGTPLKTKKRTFSKEWRAFFSLCYGNALTCTPFSVRKKEKAGAPRL